MALRKKNSVNSANSALLAPKTLLLVSLTLLLSAFAAGIIAGKTLELNACPVLERVATGQCSNQNAGVASASVSPSLAALSEETLSATLRVLAVRSDTGEGAVGKVNVEIRPGKGRVLVNTNPFVEPDTQYSADTAARYAAEFTGKSIADRDVIFSFESSGELVGGPSAGAAMAIATIAALTGREPNASVAMTGAIDSDGRIGFIGGLIEKSDAAAGDGVKLFLVPEGQQKLQYYREKQEQETQGGVVFVRTFYVPVELDLNAYTSGEFNMTTRGVATIDEAAKAFFAS